MDDEFLFFIGFVLFIGVFVLIHRLSKRMTYMERYLQNVTKQFGQMTQTAPVSSVPEKNREELEIQQLLEQQSSATPMPQEPVYAPAKESAFGAWLKRDWLMKLGALFIILGLAWFVNYAIAEGWIGPMGRITLGLVVGALVLVLGRFRANAYISQGSILMFTGALGIVLTVWAGRELYDFFTPMSSLVIMFLTSCVLGLTSIHFRYVPLAYANVLLGAVAPLMTASSDMPLTTLFTYLLVLSLGAIWVAVVTGWRQLVLLSLIVVSCYSVPFLGDAVFHGIEENGLLFSFVFAALFFCVSVLGMHQMGQTKIYDLATAALSGLFLLAWILLGADEEWQVMLLVMWTLVFGVGAFIAQRLGATIEYFFTYAGVGILFIGVATALQLDGPALTIAFILESLVVLIVGYRVTGNAKTIPVLALPTIIPILLSFGSMDSYSWRDSIVHEDSLVLVLMILSAVGLGQYFMSMRLNESESERALLLSFTRVTGTIASLYGIVYVWLASHALFGDEFGLIVALLVYIAVGSALYLSGKRTGEKWKRVIGGVLIGLTSAYLLLVAGMILGTFGRVVAYVVIGVVLVSVAWHERSILKK
jgi:hypothetical protein